MKWVEMIRVRSTPGHLDAVLPELVEQLADLPCETGLLRHGVYDGDIAALLIWHEGDPRPSREGAMIAERMRAHGTTDHAVWIPASPALET